MSEKWDKYFLRICAETAKMSKDPSTQIGAVIVGSNKEIISTGFNGFPRKIRDSFERLNNRERKLELIVHGEINAIMNAARNGISTNNCTLYFIATDSSGELWGGAPCLRCTVELIQAGIKEIVTLPFKTVPSRWQDSVKKAQAILQEAGVNYREVEL